MEAVGNEAYPSHTVARNIARGGQFKIPNNMAIGLHLSPDARASYENAFLRSGRPHVFVLGGLSFVGRNLIPALKRAGYGVRSMALTIEQRAVLRSLGCSTVGCGEPYSLEAVKAAARGCVSAVHCASAFVHYDASETEVVLRANKLVTQNVIQVCKTLRIPKLVVLSSEAALFTGRAMSNANETYKVPSNPLGPCAKSMQIIEHLALCANSGGLETIVIRPRLLWGQGDDHFLPSILAKVNLGNLRLIERGNFLTSTCHISNACEGIVRVLRSGKGGEVFFLTDGQPILFRKFVGSLLEASGIQDVDKELSRTIPLWVARRLAMLSEMVSYVAGAQPTITQSGIGLMGQEMTFSDQKARSELGYEGAKTIEQGLMEIRQESLRLEIRTTLGMKS